MTVEGLNGWTSKRLDELQEDVGEIKKTLRKMESDETQTLRGRIKDLEEKPRLQMQAVIIPFLCACIPATVILLSHA